MRMDPTKMQSTAQAAAQWSVSQIWVRVLCRKGRIKGAIKVGRDWFVPNSAKYPQLFKRGPKPA
jgi:hypothetical protein